ncbi:hypothetical protein [EBPR siphovirus 2]|nr:hypothetical protein [EBPR siphovirus 2]
MKLELGLRYLTRGGKTSGPVYDRGVVPSGYTFGAMVDGEQRTYREDGRYYDGSETEFDLVAVAAVSFTDEAVRDYVLGASSQPPTEDDLTTLTITRGGEFSVRSKLHPSTPVPSLGKINTGEGRKDDSGKLPFDLIAPEFLEETAKVLQFGAAKYEPYNWSRGMAWSRCFAALMRHMWAWWGGQAKDPETGFSHLAHACACLMFLVAYERRGTGTDDRWKEPTK